MAAMATTAVAGGSEAAEGYTVISQEEYAQLMAGTAPAATTGMVTTSVPITAYPYTSTNAYTTVTTSYPNYPITSSPAVQYAASPLPASYTAAPCTAVSTTAGQPITYQVAGSPCPSTSYKPAAYQASTPGSQLKSNDGCKAGVWEVPSRFLPASTFHFSNGRHPATLAALPKLVQGMVPYFFKQQLVNITGLGVGLLVVQAADRSGPPVQPPRLTEGIPDPQAVEQQKHAYEKSLDAQLDQGIKMIEQQNEVKKQALRQEAEMKKEQYFLQVDQQLKAQEMSVDQQANYQLMGLQQAAFERKAVLDQQAAQATLEYEQKRVADDFARTQYEHKKRAAEKQARADRGIFDCRAMLCHSMQAEMQRELARQKEAFAQQQRAMQEQYAQQVGI
ncbi:unnamed protein product [Symbiodinium sp. CCMP2456]|nr:unnamed protein product [Symbiodinium sp. CCMP2456]